MTAQGMFVFLRQIRQTGFVAADEEGIRATKIQALFELSERRCSTRGIIGNKRGFILFDECCGAVEEVPWLEEIKQVPHVEQARLTGVPVQAIRNMRG